MMLQHKMKILLLKMLIYTRQLPGTGGQARPVIDDVIDDGRYGVPAPGNINKFYIIIMYYDYVLMFPGVGITTVSS